MLFNSINYFIFFFVVCVITYILPARFRWILLLSASIFFYMMGGAGTFIVPVIITLSTFFCGILLERNSNTGTGKIYFSLGLFMNLGLLCFFKYINFFITTAFDGINFVKHLVGKGQTNFHSPILMTLIFPLGISYITFQAIGYLIEIKRSNQKAEKNLGLFATYIMFFPKLLSGPIERAHNFLPQLYQNYEFNYEQVVSGLKRILWGLFLKLVIANRLDLYTGVFTIANQHTGITLLVASIFYPFQLYADLAGYTSIAIGSAQILGYKLMENFDTPYIATSVSEFWRRWHISLSSWVNDYIYNPIVIRFRNWNKWSVVFAAMVSFVLLGFWHGATWGFVAFGFLQGFIVSIEFLSRKMRKRLRSNIPAWLTTISGIVFTFSYFCFSLIFFRASTLSEAFSILEKILSFKGSLFLSTPAIMIYSLFCIFFLTIGAVIHGIYGNRLPLFNNKNGMIRKFSYALIIIIILLIGVFDGGQFIYFKF